MRQVPCRRRRPCCDRGGQYHTQSNYKSKISHLQRQIWIDDRPSISLHSFAGSGLSTTPVILLATGNAIPAHSTVCFGIIFAKTFFFFTVCYRTVCYFFSQTGHYINKFVVHCEFLSLQPKQNPIGPFPKLLVLLSIWYKF